MIFGVWNVRTLLDRDASSRPERRTALSETRLAEEGSVVEPKGRYTFFWTGKANDEDRMHGVGLAIKTSLCRQLPDLPTPVSERLMKLRFPFNPSRHVTVISAYAPTLTSSDEAQDAFYNELNALVKGVTPSDKLILLGDFNARVGTDCNNWKGVLGPHGTGQLNSNGFMLSFCAENDLTITNTLFCQADKYKATWMHPRSKQWHLIDYAICRRRDIRDVRIIRAMDCPPPRQVYPFAVHHSDASQDCEILQACFWHCRTEAAWTQSHVCEGPRQQADCPRTTVWTPTSTVRTVQDSGDWVGQADHWAKEEVHQDWFDENDERIKELLDDKKKTFIEWQNGISSTSKRDRFKHLQRQAQTALRRMQDEWWEKKADEIETYAATKNSEMFFSAIKEVYGPTKPRTTPFLSADGSTLLNEKSSINAIGGNTSVPCSTDPPLWTPLCSTRSHRSPWSPASISSPPSPSPQRSMKFWRRSNRPAWEITWDGRDSCRGLQVSRSEALHSLLTSILEEEDVPKEFRNATFVSLFKNRGSKTTGASLSCPSLGISWRGSSSTASSPHGGNPTGSPVWIPSKPQHHQHDVLCTPGGGEVHRTEYGPRCRFIDLTKAFDTVNREALWVILSKLGCPTKFVNLIRQFHDDMTGQVLSDGEASEPFSISNGVKQGCVLAPILFNLFFTCVLNHAIRDLELGVYLRYRLDGSLFDLRRLTAMTKTVKKTVLESLLTTLPSCHIASHRQQVCRSLPPLRSHLQPRQDRGPVSASTRLSCPLIHHPNWWHPAEDGRRLQIHRQCDQQWRESRQGDQLPDLQDQRSSWQPEDSRPEPAQHQAVYEIQGVQGGRSHQPPLWLWDMDPVQETPEAAGALPYAQPPDHPEHQMEGPCFKPTGPRHGPVNQYRSHEKSTSLGWTCHPHGRQETTEATDV